MATAESLTGGRLAARLTAVPGASETYVGGVVSYATALKQSLLGVTDDIVQGDGVVSAACASAMAEGVRRLTGATWGVATTGVAGPTEQEGKPPGTVYLAVAGDGAPTTVLALELGGGRDAVVDRTCDEALVALAAALEARPTDR